MNPLSMPPDILVTRANDNSCVLNAGQVNASKITSIVGDNGPPSVRGYRYDPFIGRIRIRQTGFKRGKGIVTQRAQNLDDAQREILVGEQLCHGLGGSG